MNAEGIPNQASYPPLHELDMFRNGSYRKRLSGPQATAEHAFLRQTFPQTQKAAWETVWFRNQFCWGMTPTCTKS